MIGNVLKADLSFPLYKYGKRKSLGLFVDSQGGLEYFLESTQIFFPNDDYGPSAECVHSRGLKIENCLTVRSQGNRWERKRSFVAKIPNVKDKSGVVQCGNPTDIANQTDYRDPVNISTKVGLH